MLTDLLSWLQHARTANPASVDATMTSADEHNGSGVLLKEQIVGEKKNERSLLGEFLPPRWPTGRLISADAYRRHHGHTHHEVVCSLTSRSPAQSSLAQVLDALRGHWAIEKRLHWRREVKNHNLYGI